MVAKVDGSQDRALSSRFGVRGFPTFYLVDGWDTYDYDGRRDMEEMKAFAVGGYLEQDPMPFLNSPFGPVGQLKAGMMMAGTAAEGGYMALVERGYSKTSAVAVMAGLGIVLGLFSIIAIGLLTTPKPKED